MALDLLDWKIIFVKISLPPIETLLDWKDPEVPSSHLQD